MRPLLYVSALLLSTALHAQDAAPPKNDVPVFVPPSTAATASRQAAAAHQGAADPAPQDQAKILDSVVAIVNGEVLLQSDVEEEQRLESLQVLREGENTTVRAAQHLVTRTLILQQMKAEQSTPPAISDGEVANLVDGLRRDLPACIAAHCATEAGWEAFLKQRGLTVDEVNERWRQRMVILSYLDLRFRSGIRIPAGDVQRYYDSTMLPAFEKKHQKAPPVKTLAPRIEEVLLQEQVTKQIDDWEATLRQQGTVQILVPAYGQSNKGTGDQGGGA